MSSKFVPILPLFHQKPFPFVKVVKKQLPLIFVLILLTLSLLCYVFALHIRTATRSLSEWTLEVNIESNDNVFSQFKAQPISGVPLTLPSGEDKNSKVRTQRLFVKEMMKHSWDSYVKYAWGQNELKPFSQTGHTSDIFGGDYMLGATIVDSLSTLYIMNMTDEFERGRNWVRTNLDLSSVNSEMSVFETVIRFVGGLLSTFAFTNDHMFLQKAKHVADHILPAFGTPTGIPLGLINPSTGKARNYGVLSWITGGTTSLAGLGSHHLEFVYLSAATGDRKYAQIVQKIRQFVDRMDKPYDGLYLNSINPYTGTWGEDIVSLGGLGDSFYEYLLKSWFQSNRTDTEARLMYDMAVEAINKRLVQKSRSGLTYVAKQSYGQLDNQMGHLTCFSGGMFSLGALDDTVESRRNYFFKLGANITDTCYESYRRTATHIGPETFHFTEQEEAVALNNYDKYYILRPEVIESYFYLWRLTHNQRFRDYAWSAAQAIARHCRTGNGFSGIVDTSDPHSAKDDVQQTFFLAETLKYLYLIFSSDDLIPLNEWVFNTEAHPLPVLSLAELHRAGIV